MPSSQNDVFYLCRLASVFHAWRSLRAQKPFATLLKVSHSAFEIYEIQNESLQISSPIR